MSRAHFRLITIAGAVALAVTCSFPTDKSDELQVVVSGQNPILVRGRVVPLYATAMRGGTLIKNVDFQWSSANPQLATVQKDSFGRARVTGVNPGLVSIRAVAVGYENAQAGTFQVRVTNELEIDQVLPAVVRFGDQLMLKGVGLRNIFLASLGEGALVPDTFSFGHNNSTGLDSMRFWVPPPSRSDRLLVLGPGLFGLFPDTTDVVPVDLFEPDDTAFAAVSLNGPAPYPTNPSTQFFNPALFFEPIPRDSFQRQDWIRFSRNAVTSPITLVLTRPSFDTSFVFVSDFVYYDGGLGGFFVGPDAWMIGPEFIFCHGYPYFYIEAESRTTLVALQRLTTNALHLLTFYQRTGPYQVAVLNGYLRSDPRIGPDRFEQPGVDNDICPLADSSFANVPSLRIVLNPLGTGFSDVLTIDNPHELDWYRFRVPSISGALDSLNVTVATGARPLSPADTLDDVDFYVVSADSNGTMFFMEEVMFSVAVGTNDTVTARLEEGDYYLLVTDYNGVPNRYALCIA
ncbi:MAG: Ig-like domain-containing protein, partial [Gemmatimonadales bacterium]